VTEKQPNKINSSSLEKERHREYNPVIFRAYDIRGLVPEDLNPQVAETIGKAFGTYVLQKQFGGEAIIVGRDSRSSSEELKEAICAGLMSSGNDVIDVRLLATPMLYFAVIQKKAKGGVMITGSHNPPRYNGFKLAKGYEQNATTLIQEEILDIKAIVDSGQFLEGQGGKDEEDITETYFDAIANDIKLERSLKVGIDAGGGVIGLFAPRLFEKLGLKVRRLYCEPDPTFSKRNPNPNHPGALKDATNLVLKHGLDLGIAYDGDGDRVVAIDEKGAIFSSDKLFVLFARSVLEEHKRARIIVDINSSRVVEEEIQRVGGIPIISRAGHSFIKIKMRGEQALLGGEISGHFFFADRWHGFDDGLYASARLAEILARSGKKFSELVADIPHYPSTPQIRIYCPDEVKNAIVERLKNDFQTQYQIIEIDGVKVIFSENRRNWALIRASNTNPELTIRAEGETEKSLEDIKRIVSKKLEEFPDLGKLEW
jgi:phosphomannomutase/phosphoglucomutase